MFAEGRRLKVEAGGESLQARAAVPEAPARV